jgi:hypothetical protein
MHLHPDNGCMDLITASAGTDAPGRCFVRGSRIARVKFVALPIEATPGNALRETRFPSLHASAIRKLLIRVIGRLVAARP